MDYFDKDGGKVNVETWVWGVTYDDGTELHQFGSQGDYHYFAEIEMERVTMFVMYRSDNMAVRIDMPLKSDIEGRHHNPLKLFHGYIRRVLENETVRQTVYLFGWEDPRGTKSYTYILPDDRIVVADWRIRQFASLGL